MKLTLLNYQDIHILGIGNLGKYVAHALAKSPGRAPGSLPIPSGTYPRGRAPDPTTTLLFHRDGLARDWRKARERVGRLSYNGAHLATNYAHGLQYVDLSLPKPESHQRPETVTRPIRNLIVATKAHATVAALKAIGRRLNANSRILFLQNGMGITEQVSHFLFPYSLDRPRFWVGVCNAGLSQPPSPGGPFDFLQSAFGPLTIGFVRQPSNKPLPPGTSYDSLDTSLVMIQRLAHVPLLHAEVVSPERIKQVQLQKLVVDAAINPLSALFKCKNGDVFNSEARMHLLTRLVEEAGPIVRALLKSPGPEFDDSALREEVLRVARATGENTSSMLQDVEAGRKTEIDYLNGYLVARAKTKKLRLPRTYHAALVRMVSTPEAEWLPEDLELIQAARGG